MTGYDLTEAIREASDHLHADSCPEDMCGCRCGHYDREAEIALTAALPHLEQQIRERVAADAKAEALREAADALDAYDATNPPPADDRWTCDLGYYGEAAWLRNRADQIAGTDQYEQAWQSRDWDTVRRLQDEAEQ